MRRLRAQIERTLEREGGLETGRVNLTTRRLTLRWQGEARRGNELAGRVAGLGYGVVPFDPDRLTGAGPTVPSASSCAASPSRASPPATSCCWRSRYGPATSTRHGRRRPARFLHWFEALIALPAIAYAGRPFFRSALRALRAGHTNMDVPISLAVILAPGMSLVETIRGGQHAYFDSAITLLFFLLVGRYLDQRARGSARSAAERLLALDAAAVTLRPARRHHPERAPDAARGRAGGAGRGRRTDRRRRCRRSRRRARSTPA